MRLLLPSLLLLLSFESKAQNTAPCSAPEASQFDFWIGEWDLQWKDSLRGSNKIEKLFGNCVLQENFMDPKLGYLGKSWTVYNANYQYWQQTWVDNGGAYIHLTGKMSGDSIILYTEERKVPSKLSPTGLLKNRMVYYHIQKDSFDWSWEASTDGGQSWKPSWQIHYTRKK